MRFEERPSSCRLFPLDKHKNASGRRAARPVPLRPAEPPPRARRNRATFAGLIARYAATGLPPAYLPKDEVFMPKLEPNP